MEDRWITQKMDGPDFVQGPDSPGGVGQNGPKLRQFREILEPNLDSSGDDLVKINVFFI